MDLIIYWRFESPGRISDLMLYFHLSHRPYKCTPLNPRYAPSRRKPKKIENQSQCSVCKITNAEIDEISDLDIHKVVIKLTSSGMCLNHLIGYLELRKFGGLMGKELLKSLKDCN